MFDWLKNEIASINTPKFHVVDGSASDELRCAVMSSLVPLPPSYKEFVIQFGNARLYRKREIYLVQIWAVPKESLGENGERILEFGRTDTGIVYFNESLLVPGGESPVFIWEGPGSVHKAAQTFEGWLIEACREAKHLFSKKEWEYIIEGPLPFSPAELAIVEARKKFRWRLVGIAPNGDILFEIHNGSDLVLPYLSLGVKGRSGKVDGGVWLPTSAINPGETRIVQKDCYKNLIPAEDVEVFDFPDPGPEDRDRFWEFKKQRFA
jgi:hypothetical protein